MRQRRDLLTNLFLFGNLFEPLRAGTKTKSGAIDLSNTVINSMFQFPESSIFPKDEVNELVDDVEEFILGDRDVLQKLVKILLRKLTIISFD